MSKFRYLTTIALFCALIPLSVAVPYLFYGQGTKILFWVVREGYLPFWINFVFSFVAGIACFIFLSRLRNIGRIIYSVSAFVSILGSGVVAMSEQRHLLLVIIFFLACVLVYASEWIRKALTLPYFQSRRKWWEVRPKAVPGISARVLAKGSRASGEEDNKRKPNLVPVRVVNFGAQGCFIFFENNSSVVEPESIEFDYSEGSVLTLPVESVIKTYDQLGAGLRFLPTKNSDEEQDLQDYLLHLRRSGYVEA